MSKHADEDISLEYLAERNKIEEDFKENAMPNIEELEEMLLSPNDTDQLLATIAVSISKKHSECIVISLLDNIKNEEETKLRTYSAIALRVNIDEIPLNEYEDDIYDAVMNNVENEEALHYVYLVSKFNPKKRYDVLLNIFLRNKLFATRLIAYVELGMIDPNYKKKALDAAERKGDQVFVNIINRLNRKEISFKQAWEEYNQAQKNN